MWPRQRPISFSIASRIGRVTRASASTWRSPRPHCCRTLTAPAGYRAQFARSEEHTSELQSRQYLVCRLLLANKRSQIVREHELTKLTRIFFMPPPGGRKLSVDQHDF